MLVPRCATLAAAAAAAAAVLLSGALAGAEQVVFSAAAGPADRCPADVESCGRTAVDACCSPLNGLLVLAQQWDPRWGPADAFTMHGLWPDTCDGKQLPDAGCDRTRAYANITGILAAAPDPRVLRDMTAFWPSNKGDNDWFWTHEWVKHGTCVSTLHPRCYAPGAYAPHREVADYFAAALALRAKYDVFAALNASGIVPTAPESGRRPKNTYSLAQFKRAIFDAWGVEPNVKCRGSRLQEVWLWFKVRGRDSYYPVQPWGSDSCRRISYQRKIRPTA
ncbi:hypothetical protein H4R18_005134 [Coemansia javaensis]|uniref:ribonuclease T2 n=1 Tax=Coemansia javaensis TaxID=2761396 RepID=A0A9W8LG27_9FUNG|nr:hypothetical protein H4R18_005134 [Coemansia javaensis]